MKAQKVTLSSIFRRYEFLFVSIIIVFLLFFLTFRLLLPNLMKAQEIRENGQTLGAKLKILEKKEKTLATLDETKMRENFSKINFVMPESKDYALLFTTLDSLQQKTGVSITRTDFELGSVSTSSSNFKKSQVGDTFAIPISLEVMGTITQIEKFLMQLSDLSGRLITVDQIKLEVSEGSVVKASLTGKTFYNPLPKTIGKVDSAIPEFNNNYKVIFDKILENQLPIEIIQEANQEVPIGKENLFL